MNLDGVVKQPDWYKQASCIGYDPNWWFYERTNNPDDYEFEVQKVQVAINICNSCPVREQCLKTGLEQDNLFSGSVWGGLMYSERLFMKGKVPKKKQHVEEYFRLKVRSKIARAS